MRRESEGFSPHSTPMTSTPVPNPSPLSDPVHVFLVESADSLNIGAAARALSNFGFHNLHLVAPVDFDPEKAAITACWAQPLLERIEIHDSLSTALASMEDVVGFSARSGRSRTREIALPKFAAELRHGRPRRTALVFGPERTGLRREHLELCRLIVHIPSAAENPSFNVAQAVLLALYEISRPDACGRSVEAADELPRWQEFEQLDRVVADVAEASGFYREGTPRPVPELVKTLFRRMQPNARELAILLGLFNRIAIAFRRLKPPADSPGK
jgi:tRNA/rRNA methyltransferase